MKTGLSIQLRLDKLKARLQFSPTRDVAILLL